jgi:glutamine amidotransferase
MVAIIDYKCGNLQSVKNALERLGAEYVVTASEEVIRKADRVILPGVGSAATAMESLLQTGLCDTIRSLRCPVLGICVGMCYA